MLSQTCQKGAAPRFATEPPQGIQHRQVRFTGTVVGHTLPPCHPQGLPGRNLGEFGWIHAIACPSENEIWVGELINWRVQKLVTKKGGTR